jgi:hypothetical protein
MATQTFELVSPFLSIYAPSRTYGGSPAHLKGQSSDALVPGEMLAFNSNYGVERKLTDGFNETASASSVPAFAFFSETGRGDLITGGKVPVLQFGPYEADTMVFARNNAGILVNENDAQLSGDDIGKPVGVVSVRHPSNYSDDNIKLSGLAILTAAQIAGGAFVVGRISRILGTGANMKVRVLFGLN